MGGVSFQIVLLGALALLLVSAGVQDVRTREIANWKNAAMLALAPLWWWSNALGWSDIAVILAVAGVVFALFVGAFALGWMGGGDVKMIGALALWFTDPAMLVWMLIAMSLIGGALTLVLVLERALRRRRGAIEVPYGVAITLAAFFALYEPLFNHSGVNA